MQSVGATAVFLPSLLRVSSLTEDPASRLLLPVGYAATLGGTISMVGAGTLIVLNDLLQQAGYPPFGLFAVTPIGLPLLLSGVALFFLFGDRLLPRREDRPEPAEADPDLAEPPPHASFICESPEKCPLVRKTREDVRMISRYNPPSHISYRGE